MALRRGSRRRNSSSSPPFTRHVVCWLSPDAGVRGAMSSALERELQRLGLRVRDDWLAACTAHLHAACGPFNSLALDKQVRPPCCLLHSTAAGAAARLTGASLCAKAGHTDSSSNTRPPPRVVPASSGPTGLRSVPGGGPELRGRRQPAGRCGACAVSGKENKALSLLCGALSTSLWRTGSWRGASWCS